MKQLNMIFSDIDGTLLDSCHRITDRTRRKIQELTSSGIPFVLVSARMPGGVYAIQNKLGIKAPVICYSGGLVLDDNGDLVKSCGISREDALEIKSYINSMNSRICVNTYSFEDWIAEDLLDPRIIREHVIVGISPVQGKVEDIVLEGREVHKFLCMGESENIIELELKLKSEYPALAVSKSSPYYLEVLHGQAVKSEGIRCLCEKYGIDIENTAAFGDSHNDIDMLLACGIGIAMGNAPDEVKEAADMIAMDNNNEGLVHVLEKLYF